MNGDQLGIHCGPYPSSHHQFAESVKKTGFCVFSEAPFDYAALEKVYSYFGEYFEGDLKHKNLYSEEKNEGYYPCFIRNDSAEIKAIGLVESYYYRVNSRLNDPSIDDLMVPLLSDISKIASKFVESLIEYSEGRFKMNLASLRPDNFCVRVMRYPALKGTKYERCISEYLSSQNLAHQYRLEPHKDFTHLTLLPKKSVKGCGLVVVDNEGKRLRLEDHGDTEILVVNVGNSIQMLSGGCYRSTLHFVELPTQEDLHNDMYSVAFFI